MSDPKKYIIGLGPPRSGTTSLARLLGGCEGANVTHEGTNFCMPWDATEDAAERAVGWLEARDGTYVGDVGYYWLPYVLPVYRALKDVRFVSVIRREGEWHRSFYSTVDPEVLTSRSGKSKRQFPVIARGSPTDRQRVYYQRYLATLMQLRADGVPLTIHTTESLNVPRRILRASGIEQEHWTPTTHHCNQR